MNKYFTFESTTIAFILAIAIIFLIDVTVGVSFWAYILLSIIYLVLLSIGSSQISSGFHLSTICYGTTDKKEIAITFDDGPKEEITPEVLNILSEYNAKATFFCIGKRIKGNETILIRMKRDGHLIGNHTFSHAFWFDFYPSSTVKKELELTNETIRTIIDKNPKYFRPPYGVTNPAIAKAIKKTGFDVIGWNVRSLDTVTRRREKILNRVTENLKGGDIVLFHDTNPKIFQVLREFLKFTSDNGFKIVGLDELTNKAPYA